MEGAREGMAGLLRDCTGEVGAGTAVSKLILDLAMAIHVSGPERLRILQRQVRNFRMAQAPQDFQQKSGMRVISAGKLDLVTTKHVASSSARWS